MCVSSNRRSFFSKDFVLSFWGYLVHGVIKTWYRASIIVDRRLLTYLCPICLFIFVVPCDYRCRSYMIKISITSWRNQIIFRTLTCKPLNIMSWRDWPGSLRSKSGCSKAIPRLQPIQQQSDGEQSAKSVNSVDYCLLPDLGQSVSTFNDREYSITADVERWCKISEI